APGTSLRSPAVRTGLAALVTTVLLAGTAGAGEQRLPAALHVHSDLSTGELSLDQLAAAAERQGLGAVLLTENFLLRVEYGLPPFRALTRVVREEPSVLEGGVGRYLERVRAAQARNPRVLLVPGVEVVPHYHWTGSPVGLDMTVHNTQKNLLVFGVTDPARLAALPAVHNRRGGGYTWPALVDALPGLLIVPGALLLATKRRHLARVGRAVVVVRRRRWLAGGLLVALGAVALARAWPFTADPYPPYADLGLGPHQDLIDHVDRLGGATIWSLPEARDEGEQWVGPVRVAWRTPPYPDALERTSRYTAFGGIYEDTTRFERPGEGWDRVLTQYVARERSRPAWAVGESGFHGFAAGRSVGPIQTVFLVGERSERAVLDALKQGRMYALQRVPKSGLVLTDFALTDGRATAESGAALAAPPGAPLEVRLGVETGDGAPLEVRVTLVKNGAVVGAWAGPTPFRAVHREAFDGTPAYWRAEVRGPVPHRVLTNPVFARRP
ncbi:MAG: hypothetical protein HYS77_11350, partial [Candidatus Rokubacteria bacterium]|nr:hypothetical protein [Candidatus Rokubacteria bacterium]